MYLSAQQRSSVTEICTCARAYRSAQQRYSMAQQALASSQFMVTSDRIQNPHLLEYGTIKNYGELLTDRRNISSSVVKVKAISQKKFVKKIFQLLQLLRDVCPIKNISVTQTQQPKAPFVNPLESLMLLLQKTIPR